VTTDVAVDILKRENLLEAVMDKALKKISYYMDDRVHGALKTEAIIFSNTYGVLGMTAGAENLLAFHGNGRERL